MCLFSSNQALNKLGHPFVKAKTVSSSSVDTNTYTHADVDECSGANDCQQICINTEGSYECMCEQGFMLDADGIKCNRKHTE